MPPSQRRKRIAVAIGDPAGIGCEIALKALSTATVSAACDAVLVGDAWLIEDCNRRFRLGLRLQRQRSADSIEFGGHVIPILDVPGLDPSQHRFGVVTAENGRALLRYAETAIQLARAKTVDAVIAAPQNESAVHAAGIAFSGYPGFVAKTTATPEDQVFLMLVSPRFRLTHVTLHVSMREAIEQVRRPRVLRAIQATHAALRELGLDAPRIAVSGLNPHAGENGLFGREEIDEIAPAIALARAEGIDASGPLGADVMLARGNADAYVVMIHDQGHIPGKLEHGSAGFCIGAPILFGSVAHGSAHDIAGHGTADPTNLINAIRWAAGQSK